MKKLYIEGNYVIRDNDGTISRYARARSVYTERGGVNFKVLEDLDRGELIIPIADAATWFDEAGVVAFTEATMRTFFLENTGFSLALSPNTALNGDILVYDTITKTWIPQAQSVSAGILGIADSAGVYTYYADYAAANAAAVSGDTIDQLTDIIEADPTEVVLKDGVNYNLNGHTYENSNVGVNDAFTDNNVAATCSIFNGTIKRTNATASLTSYLTLHIDNTGSNISIEGVIFTNDAASALRIDGKVRGGHYESPYYAIGSAAGCVLENASSYSSTSRACHMIGDAFNCQFRSDGHYALELAGAGNATDCTAYSTASNAINSNTTGELNNCTGYSTASYGILLANGVMSNCVATSTGGIAMRVDAGKEAFNCSAFSTSSFAASVSGKAYNCGFKSTVSYAVSLAGSVYRCSMLSEWDSVGGHAINGNLADEVFDCMLEVTNIGANCIAGNASTVSYGKNTYKGATTDINANISQGQVNTVDTFGNLKIG